VLIHLVDGTQEDVAEAYRTIRTELSAYGEGLEDKPELLALNKVDAMTPEARKAAAKALKTAAGKAPLLISGVSGEGVTELLREAARLVRVRRGEEKVEEAGPQGEPEWRP